MSDYIKITDYAAKDALLSGNPAKLVKGAEIGADFDAVAVAVATKANTLDKLSAFAATSSAELAGVISDETGSGALVFATSPTLVTPILGAPTSGTLTNCTGLPQAGTVGLTTADSPQFTGIELGHASDTTLTRVSAGVAAVEGKTIGTLSAAQTWSASQRGTITTDNDGSLDQSVTNNFFCTPTGAVALTFTNHTVGQSGLVLFVNSSNYAITAAATTYIAAADLAKLSATGTYLIAYLDNGTNAYCTVTAALTSAGA